jgi:hypothetical protein
MFVRWKRRERTRMNGWERQGTGKWVKTAVLIESVRTEKGPRQKHVCYLGTIREGFESSHYHCKDFWAAATKGLDAAGIKGRVRRDLEATLKSVVTKPGRSTRAAASRQLTEITKQLRRK